MTELYAGSAGSGKTTFIANAAADALRDGKKVIVLVPEQGAMIAESVITAVCAARGVRQTELEILSFRRLANRFFREYGGIAYNIADGGIRSLAMWEAYMSCLAMLRRYGAFSDRAVSFIPTLIQTITELERSSVSPDELAKAAAELRNGNPGSRLADECEDIALIYASYRKLLNGKYSDSASELERLAKGLSHHRFFEGRTVLIDGFNGFTGQEYAILTRIIGQAEDVKITLCLSADRKRRHDSVFRAISDTYGKLVSLGAKECVSDEIKEGMRFKSETLAKIENNYGRTDTDTVHNDGSVSFYAASDSYEEAEFISCDIKEKCRESGMRYRDFAVIVGDPTLIPVIDAVMTKHGLPHHTGLRKPLVSLPLFRLVIAALQIYSSDWSFESVTACLKTGLMSVTPDECDLFCGYLKVWRIRRRLWESDDDWEMNPRGYASDRREKDGAALELINGIRRRIYGPLENISSLCDGKHTVKEISEGTYRFLKDTGADRMLTDEEIRLWNKLCAGLDALVSVSGDREVSGETYAELLSTAVNGTDTGSIPAHTDEIHIASARQIRSYGVKYAYLMGCCDGSFPRSAEKSGLFTENDKEELEKYGTVMENREEKSRCEAQFEFYSALTCASEGVTLTCTFTSGGDGKNPSAAYLSVRKMLDEAEDGKLDGDKLIQDVALAAEYAGMLSGTSYGAAIKRTLDIDEPLSLETTDEKISPSLTREIELGNGKTVSLSSSRMESFLKCPFAYELKYGLRLLKSEAEEFDAAAKGSYVHFVLEKFFAGVKNDYGTVPSLEKSEIISRVDGVLDVFFKNILGFGSREALGKREKILFDRLEKSTAAIIGRILSDIEQSDFTPTYFELEISKKDESVDTVGGSKKEKLASLTVDCGEVDAVINGKIDRVDFAKTASGDYFRIADYKTGAKKYDESRILATGLDMQMLLYMCCVEADKDFAKRNGCSGLKPAGMLYYPAKIVPKKSTEAVSAEKNLEESICPNGIMLSDEELLAKLEDSVTKYENVVRKDGNHLKKVCDAVKEKVRTTVNDMLGGDASADPTVELPLSGGGTKIENVGCRYCDYADVCRNRNAFEVNKNGR